jgi:hypothetical protein
MTLNQHSKRKHCPSALLPCSKSFPNSRRKSSPRPEEKGRTKASPAADAFREESIAIAGPTPLIVSLLVATHCCGISLPEEAVQLRVLRPLTLLHFAEFPQYIDGWWQVL